MLLANTSAGGKEVTAEDELKILQKLVKQRKESAEIFKSQNRMDLYEVEINQANVIETYLPEQISEEEIKKIIQEFVILNMS